MEGHVEVTRESMASLFLIPRFQGEEIAKNATGFLVLHEGSTYLITNWHVASGKDYRTKKALNQPSGSIPDELIVWHTDTSFLEPGRVRGWKQHSASLYDHEGQPLWLEHPEHGNDVDVIALRIDVAPDALVYPYEIEHPDALPPVHVAEDVSIVGFPQGESSLGYLAIWVRGTIASEPNVDHVVDHLFRPVFLVDARTRHGQSGSPVLLIREGPVGPLGVYSGRIDEQSDLGYVFKWRVIREIIEGGKRGL